MNRDVCEHFVPTDLPCDKCKQPTALRLAELMDRKGFLDPSANEVAAELRRLHAENKQITEYADALNDRCVNDAERIGALLEALKLARFRLIGVGETHAKIAAAIKAAEENSNGNV